MSRHRPAFQFYVGDWKKELSVNCLSFAARGLWFEMLLMMHESVERGYLVHETGKPITPAQLVQALGGTLRDVQKLLAEMAEAGTYSVDERGAIYSRRMVRDESISRVRREAGAKGGNPILVNQTRPDLVNQNASKTQAKILNLPTKTSAASGSSGDSSGIFGGASAQDRSPPPQRKSASTEQLGWVREALRDYMADKWGEPDDRVCADIVAAMRGRPLEQLRELLLAKLRQGRRPEKSWAWFVRVVHDHFGGGENFHVNGAS